jgi:hypothetical protein
MRQEQLFDLTSRYPVQSGVAAVLLLGAALLAVRAAVRSIRRLLRREKPEDVLTFIVAILATAGAAQGVFNYFADKLDMPAWMQTTTFTMFDLGMIACGLRARRKIRNPEIGKAGVDGALVWVIASVEALMSSTDADGAGMIARIIVPYFAASMWELLLAFERRRNNRSTIHWRITPERVLVKLGLAESTERAVSDVDAHRRITLVARRAKTLRSLQAIGARPWRLRFAQRRLDAAMDRAVEYAGLASDPDRQDALMKQLGTMYNAAALADLSPAAPWDGPARPAPSPLYRVPPSHPALAWVDDDLFPDTPAGLVHWLDDGAGEDAQDVPAREVPVPPYVAPHQIEGARVFADEVRRGHTPGIRAIKKRMNIAQGKAQQVRAYLQYLISIGDVPVPDAEQEPQHA